MDRASRRLIETLLSKYEVKYVLKSVKKVALDELDEKRCPDCGVVKSADEFYLRPSGRLQHRCIKCAKLFAKKKYQERKKGVVK